MEEAGMMLAAIYGKFVVQTAVCCVLSMPISALADWLGKKLS